MKKLLTLLLVGIMLSGAAIAATDKYSQEYLLGKKHFSPTRFIAEGIAKKGIKSALKKETGVEFDVKFNGYTTSSIKKGVFKNLELTGKDVNVDGVEIPYINVKSLTEYNYIDYNQNPVRFKSDMDFAYDKYKYCYK